MCATWGLQQRLLHARACMLRMMITAEGCKRHSEPLLCMACIAHAVNQDALDSACSGHVHCVLYWAVPSLHAHDVLPQEP